MLCLGMQVEHGITEMVNENIDLVEWMLRLQLPGMQPIDVTTVTTDRIGHSIEVGTTATSRWPCLMVLWLCFLSCDATLLSCHVPLLWCAGAHYRRGSAQRLPALPGHARGGHLS
jgi:hypothetical protein